MLPLLCLTTSWQYNIITIRIKVYAPTVNFYGIHDLFEINGWSMVWANGMHNSELVNFILESRSPFVQITSIYQKMTAKAWNWYQRTGFEEMEHKFCFGIFRSAKRENLFRCSVAPGNFPLERPKTSCSMYFLTGFSRNFL